MSTTELLEIHTLLDEQVDAASQVLHDCTVGNRNEMGLVSGECRATVAYQEANNAFNIAFSKLRAFNSSVYKNKEYQAARRTEIYAKRFSKVNA